MIKIKTLRYVTAGLAILLIVLGIACKIGLGSTCSFGIAGVGLTCPLGFVELALASRSVPRQLWLSAILGLASVVLLGRFFCGWICPAVLLRYKNTQTGGWQHPVGSHDNNSAANRMDGGTAATGVEAAHPLERTQLASWSRYAVLGGALVSSAIFGFPVFCVICPVGLTAGTLFAVGRLFGAKEPSLELLVLPALLAIEFFAFKNWCRSICPLGALLSLVATLNPFARPRVSMQRCLIAQGKPCRVCDKVCPVDISLAHATRIGELKDCTKCLTCYEKCPAKAIDIALLPGLRHAR